MAVSIGIVGAGGIAKPHIEAIQNYGRAEATTVVDIDEESAEALGSEYRIQSTTDYRDIVDEVDAVYVLTPPRERVGMIADFAQEGLDIFCEKPLAATLEDGKAIVDIVEETGATFMMGFCQRFRDPLIQLKELVDDGVLGEPLHIFSSRIDKGPIYEENWRTNPIQACGMTVESLSHDLDMLRWLGGEITEAKGEILGTFQDLDNFDDNMVASVRFDSGAVGSLQASWTSHLERNQRGVIGTDGSAVIEGGNTWECSTLRWKTEDSAEPEVVEFREDVASDMGYKKESQCFLDLITEGGTPPITVYDGMRVLTVSHQIRETTTGPVQFHETQ